MSTDRIPLDDLRTPSDLVAKYPHILTAASLGWYLRHREKNGMASAVVRLGKRLLISQTRFEQWLATRAEA